MFYPLPCKFTIAQLIKLFRTVLAVACRLHALDSFYFAVCVELMGMVAVEQLKRTSCVTNCNKVDFNIPYVPWRIFMASLPRDFSPHISQACWVCG